ncbi:centrin-1 [Fimicolochytrium jonesii]|uniref:centrin-1 n=1 Tax=Fimicolochytrium jonesii TaxID=1396493 RepID=UPI0022FECCB5|nr:centrin-1 [Fimicolochytrium jonesii]KAI8817595.1 centrin-1 [Fimicolochytrium jonesii]
MNSIDSHLGESYAASTAGSVQLPSENKKQIIANATRKRVELTFEQKQAIRDVFNLFDTDGSGDVDVTELQILMRALGLDPRPGEAEQLAATFDTGGAATLDFEEFLRLMAVKMSEKDSREHMKQSFNIFDGEQRGKFGVKDLKRIAKELGEEPTDMELQLMLSECDADGDGEINFEDWVRIMSKSVSLLT